MKVIATLWLFVFSAFCLADELDSYLQQCSPKVAPVTMRAIIKAESGRNPLALNLNKGKRLRYQAKSMKQAIAWANYLEAHNYNFDIGISQVNIKNAHKYGYRAYQLLDICTNLKVASEILAQNYSQAKMVSTNQQDALRKAISAYNTGNFRSGFNNGYVAKVVSHAAGSQYRYSEYKVSQKNQTLDPNLPQDNNGVIKLQNIKLAGINNENQ